MTSSPTIELVVPYHGHPGWLQETVRSVLGQTDPHWRLRVVQDGPDVHDLGDWVDGLGDDRLTYERNPSNLGVAANFQRCLDLADGSHLVVLGCDDLLRPNYVALVRSTLTDVPDAAVVQPGVEVIDEAGRPTRPLADRVKWAIAPRARDTTTLRGEDALASLLRGNWTYFPSLCWRRDRITGPGFRQDLTVCVDLALLADVLMAGGNLVVVPDVAFRYRRHGGSVSSVQARDVDRFDEESALFEELAERCRERGWNRAARAAERHASSRLHALVQLPPTLVSGDRRAAVRLARHVGGA
jgi:glycosyltransferase involved in cell wall biosynthesis